MAKKEQASPAKKESKQPAWFFRTKFWKGFRKLDIWLDIQVPILVLILITVLIRLPSLFEPYWYGDEGIYLTIGQGLRNGLTLYRDIFDHKTPIIYWLAALTQTVFWWKMLGMGLSMLATFFFHQIAKDLLKPKKRWLAWIATLFFVIMFNLPVLEGNIVNAELIFITLTLGGGWLWLKSGILDDLRLAKGEKLNKFGEIKKEKKVAAELLAKTKQEKWPKLTWTRANKRLFWLCCGAGICFSLAFLTKFQALFDVLVWLVPALFLALPLLKEKRAGIWGLLVGFISPILIVVLYFLFTGSLGDFINAAFLYSFGYAEYVSVGGNAITSFLFSTKGKMLVLLMTIVILWWQYRKLDLMTMITTLMLVSGLVGATLSSRAYPHYFLQIVPGLALAGAAIISQLIRLWPITKNKNWQPWLINGAMVVGSSLLVVGSWQIIDLKVVKWKNSQEIVVDYYWNFIKYMTNQQNVFGWYNSFDPIVKDNYAIAEVISNDDNPYLMIWGNNPVLYAQTGKRPISPYLTDYHFYDIVPADETLRTWIVTLNETEPTYLVLMMNKESTGQEATDWFALRDFIEDDYEQWYRGSQLELWRKKGELRD